MNEMNFDYDQLAKKLLERMPGNLEAISLKTFVDEYISFVEKNRAPKTAEGVRLVCKKLLAYFSPLRKIDAIRLQDAEQFLESQKKTAPKAVHNYLRVLKSMWNKAIEWNYLRGNPFEKVKLKKQQKQKPVFITEHQLEQILEQIDIEVVRDVVVTAFYTGCRLGEIMHIDWQGVNMKDNHLTIGSNNFETKTRKLRIIPLHPKVKEILIKRFPKVIKKEKHLVFCKSNGYGFTGDYFSRKFKQACRKAGMDRELHFHCLRHSFASSLVQKGFPLYSIKELLGHSSISCTEIYSHLNLDSLRQAMSKLS